MRIATLSACLFTFLVTAFPSAHAQAPSGTLEQQLESEYMITTPTADETDIVTMGSVLILQKKGFSAGSVSSKVVTQNTYRDGQIHAGAATAVRRFGGLPGIGSIPGIGGAASTAAGAAGGSRDFVNGEKLYVTKIAVERGKDLIVFDLISDSYGDAGRFKGSLRIQFPKGTVKKANLAEADAVIAEVLKIQPPDDANAQNNAAPAGAPAAAPAPAAAAAPAQAQDAPPPPIAPPPPPVDQPAAPPKSIDLGQTTDQVISSFGQPLRTAKVGNKEIFFYKDLKVTFVGGKVTDVQ
ncbi:MAG TPA: hypothetical protein VME17_24245 [Bryobacteraceae bacterium]|nr:hypothetical protein [Bryobacteraceae bacterium]